jgi:uncharacterized membrane protein YeaQ/YmgE (transglycosylase-associated protein family)
MIIIRLVSDWCYHRPGCTVIYWWYAAVRKVGDMILGIAGGVVGGYITALFGIGAGGTVGGGIVTCLAALAGALLLVWLSNRLKVQR